jgi:hypothetical protein
MINFSALQEFSSKRRNFLEDLFGWILKALAIILIILAVIFLIVAFIPSAGTLATSYLPAIMSKFIVGLKFMEALLMVAVCFTLAYCCDPEATTKVIEAAGEIINEVVDIGLEITDKISKKSYIFIPILIGAGIALYFFTKSR